MTEDKKFTVKTKFIFEGEFYVKAENKNEALKLVGEHCWVNNCHVRTTIPYNDVDWKFDLPARKVVEI
jgi:hypothetical protein